MHSDWFKFVTRSATSNRNALFHNNVITLQRNFYIMRLARDTNNKMDTA